MRRSSRKIASTNIRQNKQKGGMTETQLKTIHHEIQTMKEDLAIIKQILFDEGPLTKEAERALKKARKAPLSKYTRL